MYISTEGKTNTIKEDSKDLKYPGQNGISIIESTVEMCRKMEPLQNKIVCLSLTWPYNLQ